MHWRCYMEQQTTFLILAGVLIVVGLIIIYRMRGR